MEWIRAQLPRCDFASDTAYTKCLTMFHDTAITCGNLPALTNGVITYATDTTALFDIQTTATYSCNFGFRLSGGNAVRICVGSMGGPGVWNGTAPVCEGQFSELT